MRARWCCGAVGAVLAVSALLLWPVPADATASAYSITANFAEPADVGFLTVDSGTNTVYATNGEYTLTAINAATHAVTSTTSIGGSAYEVGVDQATHDVFIVAYNDGAVTVVNGSTKQVKATIPVTGSPFSIAVDSVHHVVYVGSLATSAAAATLTVIDGVTDHVTKVLTLPDWPVSVGVDPSTRMVYVALRKQSVLAVDGVTDAVAATIPLAAEPSRLAVDPTTHQVYVSDYDAPRIRVIDEATQSVTHDIALDGTSQSIALDPATHTAYVCEPAARIVQIVDTSTSTVASTVHNQGCSFAAVNTSTHLAYVTYFDAPAGRGHYSRMIEIGPGVRTSVVDLSVRSGPASGGQAIVLTGNHFTGATRVVFGGTPATSFTVNSDSQITAVTPPHAPGKASVQVRTGAGGKSPGLPENLYTYTA